MNARVPCLRSQIKRSTGWRCPPPDLGPAARRFFEFVTRCEIILICLLQISGKIRPLVDQTLRRMQAVARVYQPHGIFAVCDPVSGSALDALQEAKKTRILVEPSLQLRPLAQ